jgi:paraquat-inducible protein B
LVRELKGLVESAQQHLDPLAEELTGLVKDGRRTLDNIDQSTRQIGDAAQEARAVIAEAGQTLDPETGLPAQWTEKLEETAQAARQTLAATEKAMSRIDQALAEDSPLREEAMRAMREISSAVRSIEHVAEYLQRHPEALIRGKGKPGED